MALIGRDLVGLEDAASEIRSTGGQAMVLPLDVSQSTAVAAAADRVVSAWGKIDVWVNDATVSIFAPAHETTPDEYRRVMEVNYLGYVHGTLAALRHMRARNAGVIVQIGSEIADRAGAPAEREQRLEGRRPRVHRGAARRAGARPERRPGDAPASCPWSTGMPRGGGWRARVAPAPSRGDRRAAGDRRHRVARGAASPARDRDQLARRPGDRPSPAGARILSARRSSGCDRWRDAPASTSGCPVSGWGPRSTSGPAGSGRRRGGCRCRISAT